MRNKRLFILMIGLIVIIAIMGFTLGRTRLTWPEKFINDVLGTAQEAMYRPVGAVADFFHDLGRLSDVYTENERLRRTVAQYTQDQIRFNSLESENNRLKEHLNFTERQKEKDNYRYLIAHVVGSTSNPYEKTIKINLGSRDGIKTQMAVRTVEGLVGLVSQVSTFTSTVTLLTELDENTSKGTPVSATVVGKTESFGIVEYDEEVGKLLMTKIDESDKLTEGDLIMTSGLGSVFPSGIIIGEVVERLVGDFMTHTAIIEPAAQLDHLREVFVVVTPDVEGS